MVSDKNLKKISDIAESEDCNIFIVHRKRKKKVNIVLSNKTKR